MLHSMAVLKAEQHLQNQAEASYPGLSLSCHNHMS